VKLETITFAKQPVGLRIVAETGEDRVLLRALARLKTIPDTHGRAPCSRLTLRPSLPWDNLPTKD
jgi:hypothetical protein